MQLVGGTAAGHCSPLQSTAACSPACMPWQAISYPSLLRVAPPPPRHRPLCATQVAVLEREVESARREAEAGRRKLEELAHERDVLNKLKGVAENATGKQLDVLKVAENTRKNLEHEISGYR